VARSPFSFGFSAGYTYPASVTHAIPARDLYKGNREMVQVSNNAKQSGPPNMEVGDRLYPISTGSTVPQSWNTLNGYGSDHCHWGLTLAQLRFVKQKFEEDLIAAQTAVQQHESGQVNLYKAAYKDFKDREERVYPERIKELSVMVYRAEVIESPNNRRMKHPRG
jgi:hypothetical protein